MSLAAVPSPASPHFISCCIGSTLLATMIVTMARARPHAMRGTSATTDPGMRVAPQQAPDIDTEPPRRRLPLATRMALVRRAAPDVAPYLPLRFVPKLSNPCWQANGSSHLLCLPAFYLAGGMQCGVGDLERRLSHHNLIGRGRDSAPHWWTNHPRSRAGDFARYTSLFSTAEAVERIGREPQTLLGDSSPASFAFIMAEMLRLHYLYLDSFSKCHSVCRGKAPPAAHRESCQNTSYQLTHCYQEAEDAAVPSDFNVPAFMSTVYAGGRAPKVVVLLRDPSIRLWVAFHNYGQYPARYGSGVQGFLAYFGNQSAVFTACSQAYGPQRCALRFEALGPTQAEVFYHCDQLIKGMYSAFLPEWQRYFKRSLLVLRSETYFTNPVRALRRVLRLLDLPQLTPTESRGAEQEPVRDEARSVAAAHGLPTAQELASVRRFYAPFNQELARLLGDVSFLWKASRGASGSAARVPRRVG